MIEVKSQPTQGTCFALYLRATKASVPVGDASIQAVPQAGAETILLAEDEDMVRDLTCRILEKAGYTVIAAENGQQAYEIWEDKNNNFDMVILDVVMPLLGGRELSQKLRQDQNDIRILFISGYDSESFRQPLAADQPVDILIKPFNRVKLLERVREILDR